LLLNVASLDAAKATSGLVVMAAKRIEPVFLYKRWIEAFDAVSSLRNNSSVVMGVPGSLPVRSILY
jgi:hypothetical protein